MSVHLAEIVGFTRTDHDSVEPLPERSWLEAPAADLGTIMLITKKSTRGRHCRCECNALNYRCCPVYDPVAVHASARKLEKPAQLLLSALSRCRSVSDVVRRIASLPFGTHPRAATAMTIRTILPTKVPSSGFWAASERNGYEVQLVWAMASDAVATIFALKPTEVRDFLDSHGGRLLADDISFIKGGPTTAEAIEALIKARLGHLGWRRLYEQAISEIQGCRQSGRSTGFTVS